MNDLCSVKFVILMMLSLICIGLFWGSLMMMGIIMLVCMLFVVFRLSVVSSFLVEMLWVCLVIMWGVGLLMDVGMVMVMCSLMFLCIF